MTIRACEFDSKQQGSSNVAQVFQRETVVAAIALQHRFQKFARRWSDALSGPGMVVMVVMKAVLVVQTAGVLLRPLLEAWVCDWCGSSGHYWSRGFTWCGSSGHYWSRGFTWCRLGCGRVTTSLLKCSIGLLISSLYLLLCFGSRKIGGICYKYCAHCRIICESI